MTQFNDPLARVRIAAPCPADWNEMRGDARVRFCAQCNLNVYNLSNMSRREAEAVVTRAEGRLCVRYYRRRDGTILTDNCPTGLRALKRRLSSATQAVLSTALSFCAGLAAVIGYSGTQRVTGLATIGEVTMGAMNTVPIEMEQPSEATVGVLTSVDTGWVNGNMNVDILRAPRRVAARVKHRR